VSSELAAGGSRPRTLGRILIGFFLIWLVLDRAAALMGSRYGEAGLLVCALVVAAAVSVEVLLMKCPIRQALPSLGFGRPGARALGVALLIGLLLLLVFPILALKTGDPLRMRPHWPWLALGLFAQGGVAEELVFRGYLFGHLRRGRTFWRAAGLSMLPFVAAHLPLFLSLDFVVALTATLVAVATSFPLAHLFEVGRSTLWAPAIVHAFTHSIKLVLLPEAAGVGAQLAWMAAVVVVPYLAFAFPARREA
jgi:membrane protease YdiL (CAAX protease family)